MYLYLSLTREPSEKQSWFTPVAAVHAGLPHGNDIGVKTYSGDSMWKDFHSDMLKLGGETLPTGAPARNIVPVGFGIQMTWAVIVSNLYRSGLGLYRYGQPLNKKWQEKDVVELSRIFTQCAYEKDVQFDEKDAFEFAGRSFSYLSNDDRYMYTGDLWTTEEAATAVGRYIRAMFDMHNDYRALYGG